MRQNSLDSLLTALKTCAIIGRCSVKIRPVHRLSWLTAFVVLLSTSRNISGSDHDYLHPSAFQLSFMGYPTTGHYTWGLLMESTGSVQTVKPTTLGSSSRANSTDRETTSCRWSQCQLLQMEKCRVVGASDPLGRNLGTSSIVLTRLSGPRSRPTISLKIW
jgi:hypothetical protein